MGTTSFPSQPTLSVLSPSSLAPTRREIVVPLPLCNFPALKSLQHGPIRLSTTRSCARGEEIVNNPLFTDDRDDRDREYDDDELSSTYILQQNELEKTEVVDLGVETSLGGALSKSISIVDKKEKSKMSRLPERDYRGTPSVPIYVMLPLGLINMSCELVDPDGLTQQLKVLKSINVDGVMVDCWWGIVEHAPQQYNWSGYQKLFQIVRDLGLKLQVVMSFHQCGGNVGDDVHIPLPRWITELGQENPDIYFTDRKGWRNTECLSWGVDKERVLRRRTALEVYFDFMRSFRVEFDDFFESGIICEIEVGLGPCGELRYPSYPEENGWKYPGIGEFQCYDKYLMKSLQKAAEARGHVAWARGPENAGSYNSWPHKTGFFRDGGDYDSYYGKFFLKWYSQVLIDHGDRVLALANLAFEGCCIAAKVSGIHWWYKTASHAAELTAGFYNPCNRDGYAAIVAMLKKHEASLNFTCVELRTSDQHQGFPEALADPEGLVWQVLNDAWDAGIAVASENALPCYDRDGYNKILENAKPHNDPDGKHLSAFTYLRLGPVLMEERNLTEFERFVKRMHGESVPDCPHKDLEAEGSNDDCQQKLLSAST